jgi:hypothetical protein
MFYNKVSLTENPKHENQFRDSSFVETSRKHVFLVHPGLPSQLIHAILAWPQAARSQGI